MILHGSDDYEFVHVEEYGYVVSYAPRKSSGKTQFNFSKIFMQDDFSR